MLLKPGYKTTELLLTVLVSVGALAAALADQLSPKWAAMAAAVSQGAYAISRGLAKLGATLGPVPTVATPVVQPPAPPQQTV